MNDGFLGLTLLVLACGVGSYLWRGLGVWVADRIDVESDWFRWITCIAFAMIAGLVSRLIMLPVGELEHTALLNRLAAVAVSVIVYRAANKSLFLGVLSGAAVLPVLEFIAGG